MTSRRAVAPVIATLLLVAIAVVGGSIVFVFSQGFFSSAQISGSPNIESLKIAGYDATDGAVLGLHDGVGSGVTQGLATTDGLISGDRIAVYLQNNSVQKVTLGEIRYAGTAPGVLSGTSAGYMISTDSNGSLASPTAATALDASSAEIQPGQQVTLILQLDENVKVDKVDNSTLFSFL
jgi:flagellin-like protein